LNGAEGRAWRIEDRVVVVEFHLVDDPQGELARLQDLDGACHLGVEQLAVLWRCLLLGVFREVLVEQDLRHRRIERRRENEVDRAKCHEQHDERANQPGAANDDREEPVKVDEPIGFLHFPRHNAIEGETSLVHWVALSVSLLVRRLAPR